MSLVDQLVNCPYFVVWTIQFGVLDQLTNRSYFILPPIQYQLVEFNVRLIKFAVVVLPNVNTNIYLFKTFLLVLNLSNYRPDNLSPTSSVYRRSCLFLYNYSTLKDIFLILLYFAPKKYSNKPFFSNLLCFTTLLTGNDNIVSTSFQVYVGAFVELYCDGKLGEQQF